jgi:hypothetical protein
LRMMISVVEVAFLSNVTKFGNLLLNFSHIYCVVNDVLPLNNFAQYDQSLGNENIVLLGVCLCCIGVPNGHDGDIYN